MAAQVFLDGIEITDRVLTGSATRRLNRPSQATITVPIDIAIGDAGSRLKVVFDGNLFFHGFVLMIEDVGDVNFGYTTYNATDPMELWQWRPCRDFEGPTPGNMIDPSFLERMITGPAIMQEILQASENPLFIPAAAEGPLYVSLGGFAGGGPNLSGAPTNWPMSIAEMANLLTSTGALDIILTPIDSGGNMAEVNCYNGNYGTDRSGSVILSYAMGNHNVRDVRRSNDMSTMVNKLWYHLGPKATVTRFKANITGDDPCLEDPELFDQGDIQARREASQAAYGVRMEIQQFDVDILYNELDKSGSPPFTQLDNWCHSGVFDLQDPTRHLYRRLWQMESWIRAISRELVHVTPVRISDNTQLPPGVNPVNVGDFDIGDLITVQAGPSLRGGFSGAQRVYEYTVGWDVNGIYEISEIQTTSDQEGLS
jgi:hypothetical protein